MSMPMLIFCPVIIYAMDVFDDLSPNKYIIILKISLYLL
ncbi:MAG: hypothetical protein JETT_1025 [Candidatus Jettenia ecosi]|uniref:Uncharacterized protein n=1 Tax=Candidatus Jettenia ecosi TaxID=2494326 RepID=A0A533QDC9_9BACT|nr:MAG: hypothetical protein JETT_1025 [Candidatus Jettenia ecosi]